MANEFKVANKGRSNINDPSGFLFQGFLFQGPFFTDRLPDSYRHLLMRDVKNGVRSATESTPIGNRQALVYFY